MITCHWCGSSVVGGHNWHDCATALTSEVGRLRKELQGICAAAQMHDDHGIEYLAKEALTPRAAAGWHWAGNHFRCDQCRTKAGDDHTSSCVRDECTCVSSPGALCPVCHKGGR